MKYDGKAQCKQCPFRATSLPGWLGSYDPASVFRSIWHGVPFFCHTSIDYTDPQWYEKAMKPRGGRLCIGGLAFANKMLAPTSEHQPIVIGRDAVKLRDDIECLSPREFGKHHEKSIAEQIEEDRERIAAKRAARKVQT